MAGIDVDVDVLRVLTLGEVGRYASPLLWGQAPPSSPFHDVVPLLIWIENLSDTFRRYHDFVIYGSGCSKPRSIDPPLIGRYETKAPLKMEMASKYIGSGGVSNHSRRLPFFCPYSRIRLSHQPWRYNVRPKELVALLTGKANALSLSCKSVEASKSVILGRSPSRHLHGGYNTRATHSSQDVDTPSPNTSPPSNIERHSVSPEGLGGVEDNNSKENLVNIASSKDDTLTSQRTVDHNRVQRRLPFQPLLLWPRSLYRAQRYCYAGDFPISPRRPCP